MFDTFCACGARYGVTDDAIGRKARCKSCGRVFRVTRSSPSDADAPPATVPPKSGRPRQPLATGTDVEAAGAAEGPVVSSGRRLWRAFPKGLYIAGWLGGSALHIVGVALALSSFGSDAFPVTVAVVMAVVGFMLPMLVVTLLTYRMWQAIDDISDRATPAQAAGFLYPESFTGDAGRGLVCDRT